VCGRGGGGGGGGGVPPYGGVGAQTTFGWCRKGRSKIIKNGPKKNSSPPVRGLYGHKEGDM